MPDIVLDTQGNPAVPASNTVDLFASSATKRYTSRDDSGKILTLPPIHVASVADQTANAADTYLTGSNITIPPSLLQVGTLFRWFFTFSKTGAGVATPIWNVRFGTNGTTADTGRLTFTGVAQTANADAGMAEITAIVRSIGAAGVMAGGYRLDHNLATTGLSNQSQPNIIQVTSAGFDMTVANSIIGISVNPGASGVWTFQLVTLEVLGL